MAGQRGPIRRRPAVAGERARRRRELEQQASAPERLAPSAEEPAPDSGLSAGSSYVESPALPDPLEDLESVEADADPDRDPTSDPARPRLRPTALVALPVALLLLVAGLIWWQHQSGTADRRQAARIAAVAEAKRAAVDLLSVNHTKLADNKSKALAHLAPKFKAEYERFFSDLEETARKNKLVLSADVVAAGTVRMPDDDHVVVLLFVDQVSTNAVRATPRIDQNRVRMRLLRSGDRWLVEGLDAI